MAIPTADQILNVVYQPEWHQYDFHMARAHATYRWLCTGVGAGKTVAAVMEMLILAADVNAGLPGLIVVPDFGTYADVIKPCIEQFWPRELYAHRRSENRPAIEVFTPRGSSWIYVRSAHNRQNVDKINGLSVSWVYMEEAGRFKFGGLAWKYSLERLRVTAPYNGVFIAGSPRPGWLPQAFGVEEGLPPEALKTGYIPQPGYYIRQARTEWNTHNPEAYAERMRGIFEGEFADQELDGQIVARSGMIYDDFAAGLHVLPHTTAMALYAQTYRKFGGIDFGHSKAACALWGGRMHDGEIVVVGEWYHGGRTMAEMGAQVANKAPELGRVYCDDAEPERIKVLRRGFDFGGESYSIPARPAAKAKRNWRASTDYVRNLLVRRSGLDHPNPAYGGYGNAIGAPRFYMSDQCVNLAREMKNLRDAYDPEDDKPPKDGETIGDNHACDANRYMAFEDGQRGRIHSSSLAA
jgi:hypothetical protein